MLCVALFLTPSKLILLLLLDPRCPVNMVYNSERAVCFSSQSEGIKFWDDAHEYCQAKYPSGYLRHITTDQEMADMEYYYGKEYKPSYKIVNRKWKCLADK